MKVFVEMTTLGETADHDRLFAVVNSKQITPAVIEDSLRPLISLHEKATIQGFLIPPPARK